MRKFARLAAALAGAALLLALMPTASDAGGQALTVSGRVTCNDDGTQTIDWTVENVTQIWTQIISAEESGATTGSVAISPDSLPGGSSGTGSDTVPGSVTGEVILTVTYAVEALTGAVERQGYPTAVGRVDLPGCQVVTTTEAPTTTTIAVAAQPAAAEPQVPTYTG